MSFQQMKTPGRELAVRTFTLDRFPKYLERIQKIGASYPCFKSPTFRFTHQSLTMLVQLCDFDTRQVLQEVASLASNPNPPESVSDPCNGFRRLWRCRYPFHNYHYLITFSRTSDNGILIEDVLFDQSRTNALVPVGLQRNLLYYVRSTSEARYRDVLKTNEGGSAQEAERLLASWGASMPATQIRTRHAAVNGMKNDRAKAQWLMGTHLDVAYPAAKVKEYTLFHNPTDGIVLSDIAECLWDKVAPLPFMASCQVRHLADLLWQSQMEGHQTDWVVHSQGAIIFKAAVRHHLSIRAGSRLDRHTVAFHAGASVIASTRPFLEKAGIKIGLERINPFDLVPNLAGHNDFSDSGLERCLRFFRNVFSDNSGNPSVSPHTLPYLGVCTYYLQLKDAGLHREAGVVYDYMGSLDDKQLAYERTLNDPNAQFLNSVPRQKTVIV
jgi:hypothetical protein